MAKAWYYLISLCQDL